MLSKINRWLLELFSDSDINKLLGIVAVVAAVLWLFLRELAPLLLSVLFAYLLESAVQKLTVRWRLRRLTAVSVVISGVVLTIIISLYALPRFLLQLRELGDNLPRVASLLEAAIAGINAYLPAEAALEKSLVVEKTGEAFAFAGQYLLNNTLNFAGNVLSIFLYMVLLPLLVFFMLKDKDILLAYVRRFLPSPPALTKLWGAIDKEFGSYVRGKFIEATIVGALSWIVFLFFGMNNGFALATLIGLSVFVPFVGAIAVTIPVVLFAYLQFGWSAEFGWIIGLYTFIQVFDGQILVPLLFSEAVKIHPVALFSAIIFFGNLWGVWGVFFSIPFAAALKHIINFIDARRRRDESG